MTTGARAPGLLGDFRVGRRHFPVEARLELEPGERLAIFGTSGAGKTTILEAIAGEVGLESGEVRLGGVLTNCAGGRADGRAGGRAGGRASGRAGGRDGVKSRPVSARERGVAAVRQPTTLFPHLSVLGNVTYGCRRIGGTRSGGRAIDGLLDRTGLSGLAGARPHELSGGQRQRVALARALARPFRALLLDEPFSAVDVPSRASLRDAAVEAVEVREAVAVLVTHDLAEAQAFGHTIAVVDAGRILQIGGPTAVVRRPGTKRVAELLGYTNFLPAGGDTMWALHPDRFLAGRRDGAGLVFAGVTRSVRGSGARYACELECRLLGPEPARALHSAADPFRLQVHVDTEPRVGSQLVVTAEAPPTVTSLAVTGGRGGRPSA